MDTIDFNYKENNREQSLLKDDNNNKTMSYEANK